MTRRLGRRKKERKFGGHPQTPRQETSPPALPSYEGISVGSPPGQTSCTVPYIGVRLSYQLMRISLPEIETQQMAREAPLTIKHVFAGIAVAGYDSAFAWYTRFFGRSPDVVVTENEAMWQVTETGWIYVVGDSNRAGKAMLTLLVDDVENHVAELGERRLAPGTIETVPGLYRKAVISDPEGNMISLGEDLSTGK